MQERMAEGSGSTCDQNGFFLKFAHEFIPIEKVCSAGFVRIGIQHPRLKFIKQGNRQNFHYKPLRPTEPLDANVQSTDRPIYYDQNDHYNIADR